MYSLKNNPILYPYQIATLKLFFSSAFAKPFFLTGGTALAAFYLAHRESQDLDLFSLEPFDSLQLTTTIQDLAKTLGATITTKVKSPSYNEFYLHHAVEGWTQRIDIVQEQPKRFGEIVDVEGVRVDSLENIATNKILSIYGRLEPKDYLDLYYILHKLKLKFDELFELAKQKDTGLSEFYFANCITDVATFQTLPKLHVAFNRDDFVRFYEDLARTLLLRIKPKE